jgi:hypothetical protein
MSAAEQKKETVQRLFDALWNDKNYAIVDEICDPEVFVDHAAGYLGPGTYPIKLITQLFTATMPDLVMHQDELYVDGDNVICLWTITGTHTGEFPNSGVPASGEVKTLHGFIRLRFGEDGRVVERWGFPIRDTALVFKTMGVPI